jgi:predicted hotdog family 3-hydroxylacyl-ACP dehydratase
MENLFLTSLTIPEIQALFRAELEKAKANPSPETLCKPDGALDRYFTVEALAEILDITTATVHEWKRRGILPYRKLGDRTYFLHSEITAAIQKPEVKRTVKRKKIQKAA